jgi:predicted tellurium resistance membrane protein TerC
VPDFSALLSADGLVSLVSLTALEIVLGIDNIIFIAILGAIWCCWSAGCF